MSYTMPNTMCRNRAVHCASHHAVPWACARCPRCPSGTPSAAAARAAAVGPTQGDRRRGSHHRRWVRGRCLGREVWLRRRRGRRVPVAQEGAAARRNVVWGGYTWCSKWARAQRVLGGAVWLRRKRGRRRMRRVPVGQRNAGWRGPSSQSIKTVDRCVADGLSKTLCNGRKRCSRSAGACVGPPGGPRVCRHVRHGVSPNPQHFSASRKPLPRHLEHTNVIQYPAPCPIVHSCCCCCCCRHSAPGAQTPPLLPCTAVFSKASPPLPRAAVAAPVAAAPAAAACAPAVAAAIAAALAATDDVTAAAAAATHACVQVAYLLLWAGRSSHTAQLRRVVDVEGLGRAPGASRDIG